MAVRTFYWNDYKTQLELRNFRKLSINTVSNLDETFPNICIANLTARKFINTHPYAFICLQIYMDSIIVSQVHTNTYISVQNLKIPKDIQIFSILCDVKLFRLNLCVKFPHSKTFNLETSLSTTLWNAFNKYSGNEIISL